MVLVLFCFIFVLFYFNVTKLTQVPIEQPDNLKKGEEEEEGRKERKKKEKEFSKLDVRIHSLSSPYLLSLSPPFPPLFPFPLSLSPILCFKGGL
ncbi:hypothetical protein F5X96DRAFT_657461 [Biscogniauxia mediterranea]|nr:hypothetical protein F5X96DRAFT_657461 [Biscogniauxia mediterranea]